MTNHLTKMLLLEAGSGSRTPECENHMNIICNKMKNTVKVANHMIFILLVHIMFIIFSHFGALDPSPLPQL